jgi:hypothetical protein
MKKVKRNENFGVIARGGEENLTLVESKKAAMRRSTCGWAHGKNSFPTTGAKSGLTR